MCSFGAEQVGQDLVGRALALQPGSILRSRLASSATPRSRSYTTPGDTAAPTYIDTGPKLKRLWNAAIPHLRDGRSFTAPYSAIDNICMELIYAWASEYRRAAMVAYD